MKSLDFIRFRTSSLLNPLLVQHFKSPLFFILLSLLQLSQSQSFAILFVSLCHQFELQLNDVIYLRT